MDDIHCNKCDQDKPSTSFWRRWKDREIFHSLCKECMKKNHKNFYETNKDLILKKNKQYYRKIYAENPEKYKNYWKLRMIVRMKNLMEKNKIFARAKINTLLRYGKILRGVCQYPNGKCSGKIEAHHPNYNKPLDIFWFCRKHHELANKIQKLLYAN